MTSQKRELPTSEKIIRLCNSKLGITLILLTPVEILLFLIVMFPFSLEIFLSTTPWQPQLGEWWDTTWVGVHNFYLLTMGRDSARFLSSLGRTGLIVGACMGMEFMIGLCLAVIFTRTFSGKKILFSIMLIPMMVIPVVVGYDFYMLFLRHGPVNEAISALTGTYFDFDWLADSNGAVIALIIMDVWHWTPLMFLILFSGLVALPANPIKAAKVLGASNWQIFWKVKFPMLRNLALLAMVIRVMELMKFFDEIFVMTKGGPGFATETISYYTYAHGVLYFRVGFSAAAALIILLISVTLITFAVWPVLKAARGE